MFKKSHYKALGFVGLLTLILVFGLPKHTAGQIKLAIGSLFLPLFGLSRTANQLTAEASDAVISRADLLRLNEQLRRTNAVLTIQAQQANALIQENDKFRQLLSWQRNSPWRDRLRLARVVARDPANWWQTITIDVGSLQGMKEDFAVLTDDGLVGRIESVGPMQSKVVLISSAACKVSAAIDKPRALGVITGSASPVNNTLVRLSHLDNNSSLKAGMIVHTSGLGGIFPLGIPIGKIAEDLDQSSEARVKLSADLNTLEEVWVLTTP